MDEPETATTRRRLRPADLLFVLAVSVLAVAFVVWLGQSSEGEPYRAQVIQSTVEPTDEGFVDNVTWSEDDGVRHVRRISLTGGQVESGTVLLTVTEGELRLFEPDRRSVPIYVLVITGVMALVFAVVVLATLRGFGYVRGTGRAGEMTHEQVQESNAFYWRH